MRGVSAMNEKISRTLLFVEALILCFPLTVLLIFKIIPATFYFLGDEILEPTYIAVIANVLIIIGVISAWWLMLSFIIRGHQALMSTSIIWWFISGVIATFAVFALLYANTAESFGPSSFLSFGWGIFFLPPYIHLLLERQRKKALTSGSRTTR